jgi:hypothetical protein
VKLVVYLHLVHAMFSYESVTIIERISPFTLGSDRYDSI